MPLGSEPSRKRRKCAVKKLASGLYHVKKSIGEPLDSRDLEAIALKLHVSPVDLVYPAPLHLKDVFLSCGYLDSECVAVIPVSSRVSQPSTGSVTPALPTPSEKLTLQSEEATSVTGESDDTETLSVEEIKKARNKLIGQAILWTFVALLSIAIAVVFWVWVIPAICFAAIALGRWWASLSLSERLEVVQTISKMAQKDH